MRSFFFSLLILTAPLLQAQQYPVTSITISLPQNPNSNINNWGTGSSFFSINVATKPLSGALNPILEYSRILVVIKKSGNVVCGNYTPATAPSPNFTTPNKTWNGTAAIALLGQSCNLTPGNYEVCVRFYGGPANAPMSEEKCKPFTIPANQTYNKPQNITPLNGSNFNANMASSPVLFKWTSVSPNPGSPVTYQLKVWQKFAGQTATQAMNQNSPIVTKTVVGITQTTVANMIDPSCLAPQSCEYVWQVQATGPNGVTYGLNNGISDPTTFRTFDNNTNQQITNACASLSTKTYHTGDEIKLSDGFVMKLTANPTGTNDSLTGVGTVRVQWLGNFYVRFKGIKVNSDDKLCGGSVHTQVDSNYNYPVQFSVNALSANHLFGDTLVASIKQTAQEIKADKHLKPLRKAAAYLDTFATVTPIKMPIGYFKDDDSLYAIGFTEMIFKPNYAEFEAIAAIETEDFFKRPTNTLNGTQSIGLHGSGIQFTPAGLAAVSGSLKLADEFVTNYTNTGTEDLKLTFNKESSGHIGNGIVFTGNNTEFWRYNIDMDVQLPREWLIPTNPNASHVTLNFQLNTPHWSDYVVEGSLSPCLIPGTKGMGLQAGIIAYDHSYTANPAAMVFPANYPGNTNSFFTGLYMKNLKLTLPDEVRSYADTSKKIEVIAQNLIIDDYGLTGKLSANNIVSFPYANVGNLGASIDTVGVAFASNTLTEGKIAGKITLPFTSSANVADAIKYKALFATADTSIVFSLQPDADITAKFFGEGKLKIYPTSLIKLTLGKKNQKRTVKLLLDVNGGIYYAQGKIADIGNSGTLDFDFSCQFQHLGLSYTSADSNTMTFNPGQWAFASPQKKISGFKFTVVDVVPKIDPIGTGADKQYLFKGGVEFKAKINIGTDDNSKIKISGDSKIIIKAGIESAKYISNANDSTGGVDMLVNQLQMPTFSGYNPFSQTNQLNVATAGMENYQFLTQLKPKYLGVEVKSININLTTSAVKMKGSVEFYKKDPVYGNGFKGDIQATFGPISKAVTIQAGAIFGNTKYIPNNTAAPFKYWMVESQVNFSKGIPFVGGLCFRGFGAGVYSHMNMTPPATFNPTAAAASTFGGAIFTPDPTVKLGFKAKAIIATSAKEETFNGSVGLAAEFNNNGGLNFIQFDGLFNCGSKIGEEYKAFANGQVGVKYDFVPKVFSMNVDININKDPISTPTPAKIRLYVNGKTNKWYFKAGVPSQPMLLKISSTNSQAYLMFGNDLGTDIPTGFMQKTIDGFSGIGYPLPTFNETATSDNKYQSAKGFAIGIGIYKEYSGSDKLMKNTVEFNYNAKAGGEINASLLQYENCVGFGKGWRAKMGIGVYASATAKCKVGPLSGDFGPYKGAAYCLAEFPNPTYLKGNIKISGKILGVKCDVDYNFETGSTCAGTEAQSGPAPDIVQENVADSLDYALIKNIVTPNQNEVSRKTSFGVLLNYPYNEPFDIDEQQATGEIKTRTFKATYTVTLTQDSTSSNPMAATASAFQLGGLATVGGPNSNAAGTNPSSPANSIPLSPKGVDIYGAKKFSMGTSPINPPTLKANTTYRFRISAVLEEKINNSWVAVKKKGTTVAIKQTETLYFKTNSDPVNQANVAPSISPNKIL